MNKSLSKMHLLLTGIMLVAMLSGCKSFVQKPVQQTLPPGTPQYLLMMKGAGWGSGVEIRGEYKEGMTIDDVFEAHDLKRKFKNMDAQIIRRVPNQGTVVKMPVIYKSARKMVQPEQNYAIHPNDQIIVKQVIDTALDRFIDQINPAAKKKR